MDRKNNLYHGYGQVYSPAFSEPPSPMSVTSSASESNPSSPSSSPSRPFDEEPSIEEAFVSRRPKFANKYEEMLQPLRPVTTLPSKVRCPQKTHQSHLDPRLQNQLHNLLGVASIDEIEDFLSHHLPSLDLNQFNSEGRTALQQSCLEGNLPLAKVLVKYGANSRLTTRDGFSTLHLAVFSGHSNLMSYIMSLRH